MVITESLAKGLKNRFFLEISDEIVQRLNLAAKPGLRGKHSPAGWIKYQEKFKKIFGRCSFVFYEGGSKRKPYFGFVSLWVDKEHQFNQWNEKCLTGKMAVIGSDPPLFEDMNALFNIGEHAIARIYERGDVKVGEDLTVDIFSILPEFFYIPIWSSFWVSIFSLFKMSYSKLDDLNQIYPVIPTKGGLLFGQISAEKYGQLEIRTFVDDKNLTFEQQRVKSILINICKGMENSPMCFYPISNRFGFNDDFILSQMMCFEMLKYYEEVASVIFYRIDDDQLRYKLKEQFKLCILAHSKLISQPLIDLCKKLGVRAFLLEIKKAVLAENIKKHS